MVTEEWARGRTGECLLEFDTAVGEGRRHKMNRVAIHFLDVGTSLRMQLVVFRQEAVPLRRFPELVHELLGYSLSPIVSRRVEADHSQIQGTKRKATNHSGPWVAAKARRKDVTVELGDVEFMAWLEKHWNQRDIIRRSLQCVLPGSRLATMTMSSMLGWWYQCTR